MNHPKFGAKNRTKNGPSKHDLNYSKMTNVRYPSGDLITQWHSRSKMQKRNSNRQISRTYLNLMRLRSFPPRGKETKVMSTPGSTWATHSLGSLSSTKTTGSTRRPLAEFGVPSPLEIPFSLASISFPQVLGVVELELPVRLYDHLNRSESASDSPVPLSCRLWDIAGPVQGLQCLYAPEAFNAMSLSCKILTRKPQSELKRRRRNEKHLGILKLLVPGKWGI